MLHDALGMAVSHDAFLADGVASLVVAPLDPGGATGIHVGANVVCEVHASTDLWAWGGGSAPAWGEGWDSVSPAGKPNADQCGTFTELSLAVAPSDLIF